ncbi:MAG: hypothetical protein MR809_02160 [Rikenellaceae bacterium]|nr:hypothetical protein [Rikenellaceae bacterium]
MTIACFEKGEGSAIRLDNYVALARAIERLEGIAESIPDILVSLYENHTEKDTVKRRVRRRKNEK